MRIPLPPIEEQRGYVNKLIALRHQQEMVEKNIEKEVARFNNTIFES